MMVPRPIHDTVSRFCISSTGVGLCILLLAAAVHGIPSTNLGLYWDDAWWLMQSYQALDYRPLTFVLTDTLDSLRSELVSGGLSYRALMPGAATLLWRKIESAVTPWMRNWAMFAEIILIRDDSSLQNHRRASPPPGSHPEGRESGNTSVERSVY
jgi:hypothetical protein